MSTTSLQDVKTPNFWQSLLAEFLGTFLLVLVACGSCAKFDPKLPTDVVQIALGFGFSVATIVWAIAHVSGGHINPAVTVGFLLTRKISLLRAILYIVVQTGGAIGGAGFLKAVSVNGTNDALGNTIPAPGVTQDQVFLIELAISFVLVFTVFATCDSLRTGIGGSGPLAIGLSIAMCHLWAVPYTGAGMNPARSFGPAIVSGYYQATTVGIESTYWLGPLFGGILAGILYDLVFAANASCDKAKSLLSEKDYDDSNFDEHGRRESGEKPVNDDTPLDPEKPQDSHTTDYGTMQ